jgi:hypothetical protein
MNTIPPSLRGELVFSVNETTKAIPDFHPSKPWILTTADDNSNVVIWDYERKVEKKKKKKGKKTKEKNERKKDRKEKKKKKKKRWKRPRKPSPTSTPANPGSSRRRMIIPTWSYGITRER